MNHILKLSQKHICFLQETQWGLVQYNHLLLQSPFCTITHAPAINTSSSGVAILFPKTLTPSASLIIEPGYILSVSISVGGITVELINVYLHPEHVGSLAKTLLKHLRTDTSRSHPLRIIGGDFNQLHTKPIFQDILTELDSPPPPLIPTFRKSNGYSSPLDLFLFQRPPSTYSMTTPKFTTFWPEYQPTGHGIHICKFPRVSTVSPQPDDTPVSTIPTSVFYSPPSQLHSSASLSSPSDLSSLSRSLKQLTSPSILKAKATIWNWWRSKKSSPNISPSFKHLHLLLRLLRSPSNPLAQVPSASWEWLISHFPPDKAPAFPIMHDRYFLIPVYLLSQLCHQYQILHTQTTRPSRISQFSSPPSHTWQKCRFAAPKIAQHSGVIRSASGEICSTTAQLDTALRATRSFWSDFPPLSHHTGPLSFISMPILLSPSRPVLLLLLMTSFTPLSPPLILLLVPMVFPTLPGGSAQLPPPFV